LVVLDWHAHTANIRDIKPSAQTFISPSMKVG
jgi:hypothetical protein